MVSHFGCRRAFEVEKWTRAVDASRQEGLGEAVEQEPECGQQGLAVGEEGDQELAGWAGVP